MPIKNLNNLAGMKPITPEKPFGRKKTAAKI
jgi:hypothetical protein